MRVREGARARDEGERGSAREGGCSCYEMGSLFRDTLC
jgi:hypothetical protein